MPPKRSRLVVDARQPPALAAGVATASSGAQDPVASSPDGAVVRHSLSASTSTRVTVGVVAVDESSAAPTHFAIPAAVLQRISSAAIHHQQHTDTTSGMGAAREPPAVAAAAAPPPPRQSADAEGQEEVAPAPRGSKRARGPAVREPADEEGDPRPRPSSRRRSEHSASAARSHHEGGGTAREEVDGDATVAAHAGRQTVPRRRPLILSRRWGARLGGADRAGTRSDTDDAGSSGGDDAVGVDGEAATATRRGGSFLPFAGSADDVICFGSSSSSSGSSNGSSSSSSNARAEDLVSTTTSDDDAEEATMGDARTVEPRRRRRDRRKNRDVLAEGTEMQLAATAERRQRVDRTRDRAREAQLRRQASRHLKGYDWASLRAAEELLLQPAAAGSEDSDGSRDEEGDEEATVDELSSSAASDESSDGPLLDDIARESPAVWASNESGGGFGATARRAGAGAASQACRKTAEGEEGVGDGFCPPSSSPLARRQQFGSVLFEVHSNAAAAAAAATGPDSHPCHHTLLALRGPLTIQGPCGLIGFGPGEVSVGGFMLGRKQIVLWDKTQRAVLMPVAPLKTKNSERTKLPPTRAMRDAVLAAALGADTDASMRAERSSPTEPSSPATKSKGKRHSSEATNSPAGSALSLTGSAESTAATPVIPTMDPLHARAQVRRASALTRRDHTRPSRPTMEEEASDSSDTDSDDSDLNVLEDVEGVFGAIDWEWVHTTVTSWRQSFASGEQPTLVLAIQPLNLIGGNGRAFHNPMRRHYLRPRDGTSRAPDSEADDAFERVPAFIARRAERNIDLALVPQVIPLITKQLASGPGGGCAMVLGSADVGKSTLCRFLANALLSQHGLCYWLELDLGQPEFGVPGQLSLYCVRRPLFRAHDERSAELVRSFFVGTTTPSCPLRVARALAALCEWVAQHVARRHPVVVNTHGWVLLTGRRVSVEAVQRLLPRTVVHLVRDGEEAWADDTDGLLDSARGLNADVVGRRFLTRGGDSAASADSQGCRLPFAAANRSDGSNSHTSRSRAWSGVVHTVHVQRSDADALRCRVERKTVKGAAGRQAAWQRYFTTLLEHYEAEAEKHQGDCDEAAHAEPAALSAPSAPPSRDAAVPRAGTTLLRAPLSQLDSVAMGSLAEGNGGGGGDVPATVLAATLEHRVVAVQIIYEPFACARHRPGEGVSAIGGPGAAPVRTISLAGAAAGFPVTCYGYVESTEQEMLTREVPDRDGEPFIAIRIPVAPAVTAELLTAPAGMTTRVAIAVSEASAADTSFLEPYPLASRTE